MNPTPTDPTRVSRAVTSRNNTLMRDPRSRAPHSPARMRARAHPSVPSARDAAKPRARPRSIVRTMSQPSSDVPVRPSLVVFDLDACFWDEEMFRLSHLVDPSRSIRGALGEGLGDGVVAVMSGSTEIRIHPGALRAMQDFALGKFPATTRFACASSADTPLAVRIGRSALDELEIIPGVSAREVFAIGWPEGFEGNLQIGRTPPLSANKAATHFPILRRETGVPYDEMLFFDDCGWEDHCYAVATKCVEARSGLGPVTVRAPRGIRPEEWERGLAAFDARARADRPLAAREP